MAGRKKKPESPQLGLVLPTTAQAVEPSSPPKATLPIPTSVELDRAAEEIEDLDDYDDGATVNDVPRLRLVDPPRKISVVIESTPKGDFAVSRLRDEGTTVATVMWTRAELIELIARAQAALEM